MKRLREIVLENNWEFVSPHPLLKNNPDVKVYKNPNKDQVKSLVNNPDGKLVRVLKHKKDYYMWNAKEAIHLHIARHYELFELNEDEYSDIIGQQREKEGGFKAALKDPKDGKVYTGKTHANVYWEAPEDVRKRFTEYLDHKNRNFSRASIAGFVNSDGLWHTRKDMERLYGGDHAEKLMAAGRIQ